uniref:Uncharacterized protein n=1 Tax=Panagrolaimus sp. JU765 TaxID=591449 RepID=A0AC34R1F4_9BILA
MTIYEAEMVYRPSFRPLNGDFDVSLQVLLEKCMAFDTDKPQFWHSVIDKTAEKTKKIGYHMLKWAATVQELSWPEISTAYMKLHLGPLPIPSDRYEEIAVKVQKEFEIRGVESYAYQVLVTESQNMMKFWIRTIKEEDYTSVLNHLNLNVHVFRFSKNDEERAENASRWLAEKREAILQAIEVVKNYEFPLHVLRYLEEKTGPLLSDDSYHSLIIMKNMKTSYDKVLESNQTNCIIFHYSPFNLLFGKWKIIFFL